MTVATPSAQIPRRSRFEAAFASAAEYANPLNEITFGATFTSPSGQTQQVDGFWDGGASWRARFKPDELGEWKFTTTCSDAANGGLHDPISNPAEIFDPTTFRGGLHQQHLVAGRIGQGRVLVNLEAMHLWERLGHVIRHPPIRSAASNPASPDKASRTRGWWPMRQTTASSAVRSFSLRLTPSNTGESAR